MYGNVRETDINILRHAMFGSLTTDPAKLPPCKDACDQHSKRANYQAAIWRHCLEAKPTVPSPDGNGWMIDGEIDVHWMDLPPAPQAILECLSCKCLGKCSSSRCTCKGNGLSCPGACQCRDNLCENRLPMPDVAINELLSDDDSDIE